MSKLIEWKVAHGAHFLKQRSKSLFIHFDMESGQHEVNQKIPVNYLESWALLSSHAEEAFTFRRMINE
jgi:hypothetical protein